MADVAEAEDRILQAVRDVKESVGHVNRKVDQLRHDTGEFKLEATKVLTRIEYIETNCPIRAVEAKLGQVEQIAVEAGTKAEDAKSEAKRISTLIAGAVSTVIGAAAGALGYKGGS